MEYDFSRLTEQQMRLLTMQGWTIESAHNGYLQPGKSTVKKLIERGLVEIHQRKVGGLMSVDEYIVPLDVHMAWCQHCSDTL